MLTWREIQRQNFTSHEKLCSFLELEGEKRDQVLKAPRFPLNLPLRLAQKIQKGVLDDPLFRQFVPLAEEKQEAAGFTEDPVGDKGFRKSAKLLQKYEGRALLVLTGACAMNCRFCFRQAFDYEKEIEGYSEELNHIAQDKTLTEVILSGGDPLSLSNKTLKNVLDFLSTCSHLKRVRFHTRFPVGIPERIDEEFLQMLQSCPLQIWFVIHTNLALELDQDVLFALRKIQKLGIPVLSQTVLLKGVNDSVEALKALFETLVDQGISPYYLHQLDRIKGAAHFEVSEEKGLSLLKTVSEQLSGYALPRYVKDAGEKSKTTIVA